MKSFNKLKDLSTSDLVSKRMLKYSKMGEFKE
jgi:acetyl-CoA carboxylase carboxyl transferase subunit alpha